MDNILLFSLVFMQSKYVNYGKNIIKVYKNIHVICTWQFQTRICLNRPKKNRIVVFKYFEILIDDFQTFREIEICPNLGDPFISSPYVVVFMVFLCMCLKQQEQLVLVVGPVFGEFDTHYYDLTTLYTLVFVFFSHNVVNQVYISILRSLGVGRGGKLAMFGFEKLPRFQFSVF